MKLDQLTYFLETARQEHLGKASKILAISSSAIWHSIASLEEELGHPLFEKKGRQIRLTAHGKVLMERAEYLLSEVRKIKDELSADQVEQRGHYKIGATHLLVSRFLSPTWIELQKQHPKVSAEIYSGYSAEILQRVSSGEIDFGFCFSPQNHPALEMTEVYKGQLCLAFRKNHPFFKQKKISQLNDFPAALPKSFQGIENCETHPVLAKFGIHPQVSVIYDNYQTAIEIMKSSDLWTLLPDQVGASLKDITLYRPQGWEAPYTISAIWPAKRPLDRLLTKLVTDLKKIF